jgi:hypothetical protein
MLRVKTIQFYAMSRPVFEATIYLGQNEYKDVPYV